jgi:organic radical activating enzyme
MKATEQLNAYLKSIEARVRLLMVSRGAAVLALSALVLTLLLSWIGDRLAFASQAVLPLRIVLYLALAGVLVFGLVLPLVRLTRNWVTRRAERNIPDFEQRLLTIEKADPQNPFTDLLAEDALRVAQLHEPTEFAPRWWIAGALGSSVVAAVALVWMVLAGPGFLGYGASLLWMGVPPTSSPLYDISVKPGDKTVRRKADQLISAQLAGFSAQTATLHVKYKNSLDWEQVPMQPQRDGNGFEFLVAGLHDSLEYFVDAGRAKSKHFTLTAKDLAGVQRLRVAIHAPSWLGLKDVVDDPGGDIRTVEGAEAEVSVLMDRPLEKGALVMEDGTEVALKDVDGNWMKASLKIAKDGSYHVAAKDGGENVRITDDYFIEAKKDAPPTVKFAQADTRVSPIEELSVTVEANDDYGLQSMDLHYSVNGGDEQTVPLLKGKGTKEGAGKTLLYLENFKLKPGDLVSMYAEAKDAKQTSRTDMVFAQAEPYDLTFRQSQESGGSGGQGAGNESEQISEKQKEAIAATWNQARNGAQQDKKVTAENARFLTDVEAKIADQAKTLAARMRSREMAGAGTQFEEFAKEMDKASGEISTALDQLQKEKFKEALPAEEKALQSFLAADALFKDIQIAFNRRGGGAGGQSGASRDLERMLDLELDTEKNQYETGQSTSSTQSDQQKQIDEMMQRLKMLAQRQQQLAQQKQQDMAFQQRYEQEMLRREAEQLQRQMEDMKNGRQTSSLQRGQQSQSGQQGQNGQQGQSGQQSASSRSQSQQGQQSGQQGQSGGGQSGSNQSASAEARGMQGLSKNDRQTVDQAMDAMRQAQEEMRKAVSGHDPAAMRRASDKLAQAQQLMAALEKKQAGDGLSDLAQQAQAMADHQKDFSNRLQREFPGQGYPGFTPFSDRPRRRFAAEPPARPTTPEADSLAKEKAQMAQQIDQLQQQIRDRARSLSGGEPAAANQMRSALSEVEQRDLSLHMKTDADWIRKGWGQQVTEDEASMVDSLEKLSQGLSQAQASVQNGDKGANDPKAIQAQRTLVQLEKLRQQLERQAQLGARDGQAGQKGQSGQPNRSGQNGSQGQNQQSAQAGQNGQSQSGQSRANQSGSNQQGSQGGQQAGGADALRAGVPRQGSGPGGGSVGLPGDIGGFGDRWGGHYDPQQVAETLRQLEGLRQQMGHTDAQTWNDLNGVIRDLERLKQAQPEVLAARLNQEVLPALERLEMQMKQQAGAETTSARSVKPEKAPAGYQDAVAEYFRKLSK